MAEQHPRAEQLLAGAIAFFASRAAADGSPRTAYLTRVALTCLQIVERELLMGPDSDRRQHARLRQLLGIEASLPELELELCRRIRSRDIDLSDPQLRCHLDDTAAEQLSIDNPKYSGLHAALSRRG